MVSIRQLALAASTLLTLISAAPTTQGIQERQTYVPGTQNNTQEFYIKMLVTDGNTKYNEYSCMTPSAFPP
jgi:hypothetical protein